MEINWNEGKNRKLKEIRNVTFEQIEEKILNGEYLLVEHHRKERSNQSIVLVKINDYINAVPCVISTDEIFLKTIYESRRYNKKYKDKL